MWSSRVRGDRALKKSKSLINNEELKMPAHVLNAKTFGAAAGQMCAAAIIRGFGHLQLLAYEGGHSALFAFIVCPSVFWGYYAVVWSFSIIRRWVILRDNIIDEAEETWIEVAEECEDEVISLASGFLCAVVARIALTDSLPFILLHGTAHRASLEFATWHDIFCLWAVGIGCGLTCMMLNIQFFGRLDAGINKEKLRSDSISRIIRVFTMSVGMMFAWCMCFVTHLAFLKFPCFHEGICLRLSIALFQSLTTFVTVLVLDRCSDQKCAGPSFNKALIMIIRSLGASVGLAWEQAFHTCVHVAVEFMQEDKTLFTATDDPKVWAMSLSVGIVFVVGPAYRWYIVPRATHMIEEHEDEMEKEEEHYAKVASGKGDRPSVLGETLFVWQEEDSKLEMEDEAEEGSRRNSKEST